MRRSDGALIAALQRQGLRGLQVQAQGQSLVLQARRGSRALIVKVRDAAFGRRLLKEAAWLRQSAALGIPVPLLLHLGQTDEICWLEMPQLALGQAPTPGAWARALAPLCQLSVPPGWGMLRADGQPRWPDPDRALAWYLAQAKPEDRESVHRLWPFRQAGLIHGDLHRGNWRQGRILDWEAVAVADPWEEAARASLAGGWPQAAWQQAFGVDGSDPRWRLSLLLARIEAASYPGPRNAAAPGRKPGAGRGASASR